MVVQDNLCSNQSLLQWEYHKAISGVVKKTPKNQKKPTPQLRKQFYKDIILLKNKTKNHQNIPKEFVYFIWGKWNFVSSKIFWFTFIWRKKKKKSQFSLFSSTIWSMHKNLYQNTKVKAITWFQFQQNSMISDKFGGIKGSMAIWYISKFILAFQQK